jgi:acetyl esterase/lipase
MASLQAHIASLLFKIAVKRRLAGEPDAAGLRAIFKAIPFKPRANISITPARTGGVPGEWVSTSSSKSVLLFLHGGGYAACAPLNHRPITCSFAQAGFRVFAPDYRLAPESPFPAAVEDALAVCLELLQDLGQTFPVPGDAAGGGLVLATILSARAVGKILPAAATLFSPWTDLAVTGESVRKNANRCSMFSADFLRVVANMYLQGKSPTNPLASPLYADLAGLPPLLIHVGANETLLDDSVRLAERARQSGVDVRLKIWPVVPHGWQLLYQRIPEATDSLTEAAEFLRLHEH